MLKRLLSYARAPLPSRLRYGFVLQVVVGTILLSEPVENPVEALAVAGVAHDELAGQHGLAKPGR